jgi:hypothetical protein
MPSALKLLRAKTMTSVLQLEVCLLVADVEPQQL